VSDEVERSNVFGVLRDAALQLGFEIVGVTAATDAVSFACYQDWIQRGCNAGMKYLTNNGNARQHPRSILPDVRSLMMLGVSWQTVRGNKKFPLPCSAQDEPFGTIASYATSDDYHQWIRERLKKLSALHRQLCPTGNSRGVVGTAPLLEREYAVAAGLGTIGKNTMLINNVFGSQIFLAALLSTENLINNEKIKSPALPQSLCDNCNKCIKACPTSALIEPYKLDARKCINYWTIETKEKIPPKIANVLNNSIFGCERCVNACPYNKQLEPAKVSLTTILSMEEVTFKELFGKTPLERVGLDGLKRTAEALIF
jgi:epoxyqueuosine reductase